MEDAWTPREHISWEPGGAANLAFLPRARRTYTALAFTVEQPVGRRFDFLASYVLSRSYGNYAGLYDYRAKGRGPQPVPAVRLPGMLANNTGLLPNDRTHVLKFSGAYRLNFGLTVGTALAWMSGTPRNELIGGTRGSGRASCGPEGPPGAPMRSSTPISGSCIAPSWWGASRVRPILFLDLFQIGNRRSVLIRDDLHYGGLDEAGNPVLPNPSYHRPLEFQPPMSARLGVSVDFGAEP